MKKFARFLVILAICFFGVVTAGPVIAQNKNTQVVQKASPSPSSEAPAPFVAPSEPDRFTLFWPLTAGKTKADSLYFLKRLKEDLRGFFIFGKPQKAEYNVFLGTKRVLEADSLIQIGKTDLASQSLDDALKNFDNAKRFMDQSQDDSTRTKLVGGMKSKLGSINILLDFLISRDSQPLGKIKEAKDIVSALAESL